MNAELEAATRNLITETRAILKTAFGTHDLQRIKNRSELAAAVLHLEPILRLESKQEVSEKLRELSKELRKAAEHWALENFGNATERTRLEDLAQKESPIGHDARKAARPVAQKILEITELIDKGSGEKGENEKIAEAAKELVCSYRPVKQNMQTIREKWQKLEDLVLRKKEEVTTK